MALTSWSCVPHGRSARPATDVVKISIVVACYFAVSIALVFFNKLIMTPEIFPFPLMVSWFQFLVALVCVGIMGWLGTGYAAPRTESKMATTTTTTRSHTRAPLIDACCTARCRRCRSFRR